jgi:integrase
MYVDQKLTILFFRSNKKENQHGQAPLYVRISIDGACVEFSSGLTLRETDWNRETKTVTHTHKSHAAYNQKIQQISTDLKRHFDLVKAVNELATPLLVLQSYRAPAQAVKQREEKTANLQLSDAVEQLCLAYVDYYDKHDRAYRDGPGPHPLRAQLLQKQKESLQEKIAQLLKKANAIYDNKGWTKTLLLAMDEHLLHFLQLCATGHRSPNTLEKMVGRKRRVVEFLTYRHKGPDLPFSRLEFKFLDQFKLFLFTQHGVSDNTATKYISCLKEILDRAVSNGWISANIFGSYRCSYQEVDHIWLTPQQLLDLMDTEFDEPKYNLARDLYIFSGYTGLAYTDLRRAGPANLIKGLGGKVWFSKKREKTKGDETLPLMPIALALIEKYRLHPVSIRRQKLFPVPTNEQYNRCLKAIGKLKNLPPEAMKTHQGRFFFANEILFNNGIQSLKMIAGLMGHKAAKSAELYVKANLTARAESMQQLEDKLFRADGTLKTRPPANGETAKVIALRSVS